MAKLLEVIVTSVADAVEAEAGGADRLELVRDLGAGGLTPEPSLVESVLAAVRIPVRVMLRENSSMMIESPDEIDAMQAAGAFFAGLPIDGLVAGFLYKHDLDRKAMEAVFSAVPDCRITFHRAFDELPDPAAALRALRDFPRIDRILTTGGSGDWEQRKERLVHWQRSGGDALTILVGAGLMPEVPDGLRTTADLREVHIGRAARLGQSVQGPVQRDLVRAFKSALQ